ncbi:SDR family NAD(P)-dependent oxidoreductase [Nonomuraea cavernae]|uniref:Short chain dehydrogenase/reductase n=1 Tax=Nonomuraea cavernae TaxID=2045107 RepID=A0A917Z3W6_9ACTN|nr:SDR family NAD(P)-dependent oxidoreductase [Nonomuraea cavernae]MCA2188651.1 SDR family NAD(P)-dependent oxidoreductase [Nonomuraea cavernae]GGO74400.1 putative short chain dehydrogenase/reductase [Nonomuraea cavernae]
MRELFGKVAVVTGAASGIGRALSVRLAAEGMSLMLADVDPGGLAETAELAGNGKALTQITDVSDEASVHHLADRAFGELGAVHLLCNNAGVFQRGHMWTRTPEDFSWLLGVNLWGVLHGIQAFVPRMIEQDTEGHIVNTVSVAGLLGAPSAGGYAVSKYAAYAATQSLAQDLAAVGSRLRVTALCPGGVRTRINHSEQVRPAGLSLARGSDDPEAQERLDAAVERGIEPERVADLVVEAIHEERFLVLTHPDYGMGLRRQTDALLTGGIPPLPAYE